MKRHLPRQRGHRCASPLSSSATRILTVTTANAFALLEDPDLSERNTDSLDEEEEMDECNVIALQPCDLVDLETPGDQ